MKYGSFLEDPEDPDDVADPVWAVIDPFQSKSKLWLIALKSDSVRLESTRIFSSVKSGSGFFKIRVKSLTPTQLIRICRSASSELNGLVTENGFFLEAIQGRGIFLPTKLCFVCFDRSLGREHFARIARAREKGGSGA